MSVAATIEHSTEIVCKGRIILSLNYRRTGKILICSVMIVIMTTVNTWAGTLKTVTGTAEGDANPTALETVLTSKCTYLTRFLKPMELRSVTGQKIFGYDTVQGSCSDGTYGYFVMYNRILNKCKIAKLNLNKKKKVAISKTLPLGHGNDITYNSRTRRLVVANSYGSERALTQVSPKTLKVISVVNVEVPGELEHATQKQLGSIRDFSAVCYDPSQDAYMLKIKGTRNMLAVDSSFRPFRYIRVNAYNSNADQNMECRNGLIFRSQSGRNILTVYDWDGRYKYKVNLNLSGEIESVFFRKNTLFASVYRSYYKTRRKLVLVKKKGRKVPRIKTVKKLVRNNYVVKIKTWK